jgi:Ni/Co efflux regulator RcnB
MTSIMARALGAGLAMALMTAPLAMAQNDHPGDAHGEAHGEAHGAPAGHPAAPMAAHGAQPGHGGPQMAPMAQHAAAPGRQQADMAPRGGPAPVARGPGGHDWRSGARYTGGRHVVDYNRYHLRRPPHGYEWVQDGNQFVLIAISTGIIASVLAASGY